MEKPETRDCPACGQNVERGIGQKNGFEIFECRSCRSLYTGHVPTASDAQNYDEYYEATSLSIPEFVNERLHEILRPFDRYRRTNRLLDIGFGAGTLMEVARELKWEVTGEEISKRAYDHMMAKGFDVVYGDLKSAQFPTHYFDVVTASEILEHMSEPQIDLREIVRILRPGGLFWATTPSARSISFRLLKSNWSMLAPPEHLQLYSIAGARKMLSDAGFEIVRFKTHGVNPVEIKNHFWPPKVGPNACPRVDDIYRLNESLSRSGPRKFIKRSANGFLNLFKVGDSMKIFAETRSANDH